jgi:hypothetical protein
MVLEAASGFTFIRFISTLGFSVTHLLGVDAVSIGTLPLVLLAAAFGTVIEWEFLEAAEVTFIRFIGTLSDTITVLLVADALTILAGELRLWVAATSLLVVEWEVFEAARFLVFIRLISALGFAITLLTEFDAVSIGTFEFILEAAALLVVVEAEFFEAARIVAFIRVISTLGSTITELIKFDAAVFLS